MSTDPILILQMQRMGDLVLTFPLLARLAACFPQHPLWVVGEPRFFKALMPLSPPATYFGYHSAPKLARQHYHAVINLSHRPEAAHLAGTLQSDERIGPWLDAEQRLFMNGNWQLYRTSLTHNNYFNRYHWSDLNALDSIPDAAMLHTNWPKPRAFRRKNALPSAQASEQRTEERPHRSVPKGQRIGLFLGASEPLKHPDAPFWIALAKALLLMDMRPVLLGGEAEKALGNAVAKGLKAPQINLCGRFKVRELASFITSLDLLITPDTGPMHVAAWSGTPTLNISLGPVNPWETGPSSPRHHIVRAALSCAGCWTCTRLSTLCHERVRAGRVAAVIRALLAGEEEAPELAEKAGGLELLRTARGPHGLYRLRRIFSAPLPEEAPHEGHDKQSADSRIAVEVRDELSHFWQAWFGSLFGRHTDLELQKACAALEEACPDAVTALRRAAAEYSVLLSRSFMRDPGKLLNEPDFWQQASFLLRPLSGYIQMYVQNAQGSRDAFIHALSLLTRIADANGP